MEANQRLSKTFKLSEDAVKIYSFPEVETPEDSSKIQINYFNDTKDEYSSLCMMQFKFDSYESPMTGYPPCITRSAPNKTVTIEAD